MSDGAFLVYHIHWNIITIKLIVTVTYLKKKAILLGGLITYPFFFLWIWQKKKGAFPFLHVKQFLRG